MGTLELAPVIQQAVGEPGSAARHRPPDSWHGLLDCLEAQQAMGQWSVTNPALGVQLCHLPGHANGGQNTQ
jgi:hypothetical protein